MYCSNCGSPVHETQHNCTACGQPIGTGGDALGTPAPTHLVFSILVTLFCCQIFGIVAIVYSAIATGKNSAGDYAGARQAAGTAKVWNWVGFGIGFIFIMLYALLIIIGAMAPTP